MAYNLSPIGECQFTDANGSPYSGAKLFIYTAGSSTKTTTYQDNGGITPHANPIILNTKGEVADGSGNRKPIWLPSGASYKFILAPSTDTDPPSSSYWTIDNIVGINDTTVTISEWITGPTPTYVSATKFTLVGDQTTAFHVGRRLKTTNSGGTIYGSITVVDYNVSSAGNTTVTVSNDSGNLDSGLSAVFYGIISASNTSLAQPSSWGLTTSDDTANAGPNFTLDRVSASPAASDIIGSTNFTGRNSSAVKTTYAQIQGEIVDPTAASEDGQISIWTIIAGTLTKVGKWVQGLQIGSPTGGDKGPGTLNSASAIYENNNHVYSAANTVPTAGITASAITRPKLAAYTSSFVKTTVGSGGSTGSTITHGLGTDDVDVIIMKIYGSVDSNVAASVLLPSGGTHVGATILGGDANAFPTWSARSNPSTGTVNIYAANMSVSTQDIAVYFTILPRA